MTAKNAFLSELEEALAHGSDDRRAKTLRRVTDLFVFGSSHFSGDHVALFDGVFGHLVADLETDARAALADRLKSVANAPPGLIRKLAFDDAISVAGPILENSPQIDNAALVESARTKSQDHLLAIAKRPKLAETITDVLVERGDRAVTLATARNAGAIISDIGYVRLVKRSEGDDELMQSVGARPEIPRQHFLKLLSTASKAVRMSLQAAHPENIGEVDRIVAEVATRMQTRAATASHDYRSAQAMVGRLQAANKLTETVVESYARDGKFEETAAALSLMGQLPIDLVERAMVGEREETVLIVAKAVGLSWQTARAVLQLCAGKTSIAAERLESSRSVYNSMKRETAVQVLDHQRGRR